MTWFIDKPPGFRKFRGFRGFLREAETPSMQTTHNPHLFFVPPSHLKHGTFTHYIIERDNCCISLQNDCVRIGGKLELKKQNTYTP